MGKTRVIHTRLTEEQERKLDSLAARAGVSRAWIVRALIDRAEVASGVLLVGAKPIETGAPR